MANINGSCISVIFIHFRLLEKRKIVSETTYILLFSTYICYFLYFQSTKTIVMTLCFEFVMTEFVLLFPANCLVPLHLTSIFR